MKTNNKLLLNNQGPLTNGLLSSHKGKYQSTNQRMSDSDTLLLCVEAPNKEPDASISAHATITSKQVKQEESKMEPSCSHSCDLFEETRRIAYDMNIEGNDLERRPDATSGDQPIDDIEREDFEEENRILKLCPNESMITIDGKLRYDRTLSSASSSLTSSSETISALNMMGSDYSLPGCSKDTVDDNSAMMKSLIDDPSQIPLPDDPIPDPIPEPEPEGEKKEDFMQKLLSSTIEEKKDYPKGKLYKAEEMDNDDDDCDAGTSSNVSSVGSSSSFSKFAEASTSNADRLLGLDNRGKKNCKTKVYQNYMAQYCNDEDDSEDDIQEESWCTCLSSHEDEDDDSDGTDPDIERVWRKRRYSPSSPVSAKKFCPDGSYVSCGESFWPPPLSPAAPAAQTPPPDIKPWLAKFQSWTNNDKIQAIDALISRCAAGQVRHMMKSIEPLFQRDFISLLPKELALTVLGYLQPKDLLRAAQTCQYWRWLADDNLLWKEQCRRIGITAIKRVPRHLPRCASPWKAAYMRQYLIENRWLHKPIDSAVELRGHDDHVITCLQFYGNRILSGSDDTTLKVWSAATGKCLRTLVGHSGGVWSSQMVGHLVISGSTDRTLRVWNAKSGRCLKVLAGHTSTVRCMHLYQDRVVSGSRDATLRLWSIPDGRCIRVLVGHMAAVRCVQYDGKVIVSGAYDYFVKVWNPETGECLHTLAGHTNRVYSLQFDGVHVVSGSLDTSIRVWDVETGQLKHTLTGHQSLTSGMELHSNILVSGNADSTVKVWDITTGHCLHTLSGPNKHQSAVTCLQSSNRFVVTSSDDGTVKLWDVHTGEFIRNLVELGSGGSGGVVWRIRASATKLVCAVGSRNGTEETKLLVLNFDLPGSCRKCDD